ncbi:MAG: hypothetical protein KBT36_07090 [Kurthia sp.]|nr:hypothetical protein [Candidatus Kurthia equi]
MKSHYKKVVIIALLFFTLVLIVTGQQYSNLKQKSFAKDTEEYTVIATAKKEKRQEIEQAIINDIPGFVAWGDSLTNGAGGEGVSYPKVLQQLIVSNIDNISVVNNGVGGETTNTIMGRIGNVPFVVEKEFTIPATSEEVEITLSSSNGNDVAPLRQGDLAMNPVTINGVKGTITIDQEDYTSENFTYYFKRLSSGESILVNDNTIVETDSSEKYENYVPIVFMGTNGGFSNNANLISQINSVLNMEKSNEKYIVIGLTTDNSFNDDLEKMMESEYGERYINIKEIISDNGLERAGIEPTAEDIKAMEKGMIPPSLLSDNVHFNSKGYELIGNIVYERMVEIGYFDNILKLKNELKAI